MSERISGLIVRSPKLSHTSCDLSVCVQFEFCGAIWQVTLVLKFANVRSWSRFEKDAAFWMLSISDDCTFGQWKRASKGWEPDPTVLTRMERGCSVDDFVQRIVASAQKAHT